MAGRIRDEDIALVRERARIDEVVKDYVSLKSAGGGSLKGLCPFHEERSPSFHVTPARGMWYCFGCGEGGDVLKFLQKIDHMSFAESVEKLAGRTGVELRYVEGGAAINRQQGQRTRLVEAHKVAADFYRQQLGSPEAQTGREFLTGRGFDAEACGHFGVGYAPKGWDALTNHLRQKAFTDAELLAGGLVSQGNRGVYDRFRGRLVWPIRDLGGDVIGFGARKLYDDDDGPKYLNTPETPLYKKSQVLYGIDLARRDIAKQQQAVIVEGYTDVMACHLAGITTAVATCGTSFGAEHIKVLRRLLMDDDQMRGHVIFTFDGDAAGQKAALRAFEEDQRFVSQTFVAVEKSGMDPCELRQAHGDAAVRELVENRSPLFEFAIRSTLAGYNLETAEGRVGALQESAPLVARIKDPSLRPEYTRMLAGWLGIDMDEVRRAVDRAARLFGRVIVAVAVAHHKKTLFSLDERLSAVAEVVQPWGNVQVLAFDGLVTEFAGSQGACALVRGVRSVTDFDFEAQLAGMNRALAPGIESVFLTPDARFQHISSTLVREIATLHGDVSQFVAPSVLARLHAKLHPVG